MGKVGNRQTDTDVLTTGQAARICDVTPDTVLKWIHSGRLIAKRTVGGHHRIRRADLERMVPRDNRGRRNTAEDEQVSQLRYCWEYNGRGKLLEGCAECAVYKMRAQRCYEVVQHASEIGHSMVFCKGTCLECEYYRVVHKQAANVLTITDNQILAAYLRRGAEHAPFNLEFADCEYTCSTTVDRFRPDYAIIDCSLGPQTVRGVVENLIEDPRIPHVRVILAVEEGDMPDSCDREIFARISKPFDVADLMHCIGSTSGNGG